jgi:hypothetical protein
MIMRIQATGLLFIGSLIACGTDKPVPAPVIKLPPGGGVATLPHVPGGGAIPHLFGGSGNAGSFTFTGPTAPGSASYSDAPVVDPNGGPPGSGGGGSIDVTIGGTAYLAPSTESAAFVVQDLDGTDYFALDGFYLYNDAAGVENATEVIAIVLKSDFVVGAPIAFDGIDRVALFAAGPTRADAPAVIGAAITGALTITSGQAVIGSTITATVSGDFGPIDFVPDGGGGGSGSGGGGGGPSTLVAGNYTLAIAGPSQVYCDGTLAGHEADFAAIGLGDLALVGGPVALAIQDASNVTLDGAAIAGGFGATPLALSSVDTPQGLFAGFVDASGAGPDATELVGKYLVVDGSTATATFVDGGAGAGYATADRNGTCTVAFGASLTAP